MDAYYLMSINPGGLLDAVSDGIISFGHALRLHLAHDDFNADWREWSYVAPLAIELFCCDKMQLMITLPNGTNMVAGEVIELLRLQDFCYYAKNLPEYACPITI